MAFIGSKGHTALIYVPHLLLFCAFGIMLGGIAAQQHKCGSAVRTNVLGVVNYLAPTSCDRLYSLDWWITFYQLYLWLALAPLILGRQVHKGRNAATGLLIVGSLLAISMTNTWYHAWSGVNDGHYASSFDWTAKAVFTGALVAAVADLLMLLFIGLHDEEAAPAARTGREEGYTTSYVPTAAVPEATPVHVETAGPIAEIPTETVSYRPGPVER